MGGLTTIANRTRTGKIQSKRFYNSGMHMMSQRNILSKRGFNQIIKKYYAPELDEQFLFLRDFNCNNTSNLSKNDVLSIYNNHEVGDTFLAPYYFGIEFYDFKNKQIWSLSNHHIAPFRYRSSILIRQIESFNQRYGSITVKNITDFKSVINEDKSNSDEFLLIEQYYKDLYFFLEFIEDYYFKTDFEEISFKDLTLQQIFDRLNNLKHKNNEAPYLSVIINDWKIIDLRDFNNEKEAFTSLKSYLEQEKLLNDSDRLCWDIYIDNI